MVIHYLFLHDLFPKITPFEATLTWAGMLGLITIGVQWKLRSKHKDQPFPPLRWILLGAAVVSLIMTPQTRLSSPDPTGLGWDFAWSSALFAFPFLWLLPELIAIWIGGTLMFTGIATLGWWAWHLLGIRGPAMAATAKPRPGPPSDSPAVVIACDRCREAAKTNGGDPLIRIAETNGQRVLYRCSACDTFWERDVNGTRVIPALRARRDYPGAVA